MIHISIKTTEDNFIHFDSMMNNYTLCGLETGGDKLLGIEKSIVVNKKVNCPHCIRIVKYCHEINKSEFNQ